MIMSVSCLVAAALRSSLSERSASERVQRIATILLVRRLDGIAVDENSARVLDGWTRCSTTVLLAILVGPQELE